jgi:hypothetical protein
MQGESLIMKIQRRILNDRQGTAGRWLRAIPVAAIGLLLVATLPMSAQEKQDAGAIAHGKGNNSIGFIASKDPSAKEVGLPLYPGARPHKENSDDSPAAQLGLWGGASGFKLVVLKLESNDPPEKITPFYHQALAKYGRVLNCSDLAKSLDAQEKKGSPNELNCHEDHPESGETVLKAGSKEKQHIVAIKREGDLSVFQLVYVETPVSDGK